MKNNSQVVFGRIGYGSFGSVLEGRKWEVGSGYRYGFNGKEQDDEVDGNGNQYDYGFRIYNSRLGKFLSVDPLTKSFPRLTPYQFASNSPIWAIDLDGLEAWIATREWNREDLYKFNTFIQTEIKRINAAVLAGEVSEHTCFDCADFAVHLIIQYAFENGLPLDFTDYKTGELISAQDTKFTSPDQFENDKKIGVRAHTTAASLRNNDMVEVTGVIIPGDNHNTGAHNDVVRGYPKDGRIPSISGTFANEKSGMECNGTTDFNGVLLKKQRWTSIPDDGDWFYRWKELASATPLPDVAKIEPIKAKPIQTETEEPKLKKMGNE